MKVAPYNENEADVEKEKNREANIKRDLFNEFDLGKSPS